MVKLGLMRRGHGIEILVGVDRHAFVFGDTDALQRGSPQVFPVDHGHRPIGGFKVVEQPRVDGDFARLAVPASVGFEIGTVGINIAPARAAKMIGNFFGTYIFN